jgi:hypothetical protein
MNAPEPVVAPSITPADLDAARGAFLGVYRQFISDRRISASIREQEFRSTVSAISQISIMAEMN